MALEPSISIVESPVSLLFTPGFGGSDAAPEAVATVSVDFAGAGS